MSSTLHRLCASCLLLLLLGACATVPPPVPKEATAPPPACAEYLSPEEDMHLFDRHLKLVAALASGRREAARSFYDDRALIAGPGIVGAMEFIAVNHVDNPHGEALSVAPQAAGLHARGTGACNVQVQRGNYISKAKESQFRQPFTIVWVKTDGE